MLYFLSTLVGIAVFFSFFEILPYVWWLLLAQVTIVTGLCFIFNLIFARLIGTAQNYESALITGLIISLIIGPFLSLNVENILFLILAPFFAMASKYVLAVKRKHIFNPAAFGVLACYLTIGQGASWWVGNLYLLPVIFIGGAIIIQKIRRWNLIASFLGAYLGLIVVSQIASGTLLSGNLPLIVKNLFLFTPLFFFAFVMLSEPLTGPRGLTPRVYYGIVIGIFLFVFQQYLPVPYTLELSLLAGNIFARVISPDSRLSLILKRKEKIDTNVYNFWFEPDSDISYIPGQFLEYTLVHNATDSRGHRRYFTIASAPSEKQILISTKILDSDGSSFKKSLRNLEIGDKIVASNLEGDFVLPRESAKKLAFIAGGIGVTPFRSIVKSLIDQKLKRDIIMLYSNKTKDDIVFGETFEQAKKLGLKTVYINTDTEGFINEKCVQKEIPDWKERIFYVSGPEPMVKTIEKILEKTGIPKDQIKRDYFPGYTEI